MHRQTRINGAPKNVPKGLPKTARRKTKSLVPTKKTETARTKETTTTKTPAGAPLARERVLEHLQTLGALLARDVFDEVMREAEQCGWLYLELLDRLVGPGHAEA